MIVTGCRLPAWRYTISSQSWTQPPRDYGWRIYNRPRESRRESTGRREWASRDVREREPNPQHEQRRILFGWTSVTQADDIHLHDEQRPKRVSLRDVHVQGPTIVNISPFSGTVQLDKVAGTPTLLLDGLVGPVDQSDRNRTHRHGDNCRRFGSYSWVQLINKYTLHSLSANGAQTCTGVAGNH